MPRLTAWFISMALLVAFFVVIGKGITGCWKGFLIDSRNNRISLSRFQLVLWTIVIVSAFGIAAIYNVTNESKAEENDELKGDPLNIKVLPEVWAVLGISVASLASAELIKQQNQPDPSQDKGAAADTNVPAAQDRAEVQDPNLPAKKQEPKDADALDLFRGETVGADGYLEVGKVQMFLFTLIVVYAYGTAIAEQMFANTQNEEVILIGIIPAVTAGMLVMLGISQVGYVVNKYVSYGTTPGTQDST